MKMEFSKPAKEPVTIRVTFNDVEVLLQEFAIGTTPKVEWNPPPKTSGVVQLYLVEGDAQMPLGSATYWGPDLLGARMLAESADKLAKDKKAWQARTKLMLAAKLFEKFAPDSEELADVYLGLSFICFGAKARKHMVSARRQEALSWYEKAISVWERNANIDKLGANLTNLSVMYARLGDRETGLARAERGLAIARIQEKKDPEAIHAWTQAVWHMLALGKLDEAESAIADGLTRFDGNPQCAYLWDQKSQLFAARSADFKKIAEAMLPPDSCPLD
jgi:tetratricopeptide (TPR) repeat protein